MKDKNEFGSTYILFKAGNAMSAVVFWAESDGSNGDVTNMPSPNFYNSSSGLIKLPDMVPQRTGYVFAGWTDKEHTPQRSSFSISPEKHTFLTAEKYQRYYIPSGKAMSFRSTAWAETAAPIR